MNLRNKQKSKHGGKYEILKIFLYAKCKKKIIHKGGGDKALKMSF